MEKNVNQRLIIIGVVLLIGIILLYPPSQKLRPGLDIAGGTSLIFEVDTTGAEQVPDLAERVKQNLQKRVDPKGVYNLTWRVYGRNRIEVQMPLPPKDAQARRDAFANARDALFDLEIRRGALEEAVRQTGAARDAALRELARRNADAALAGLEKAGSGVTAEQAQARRAAIEQGVADRERLLFEAAERHDAMLAAREALERGPTATAPTTEPATTEPTTAPLTQEQLEEEYRDASELYEDAVDAVLATNLNRRRFQETIELDPSSGVRRNSLEYVRQQHPDLVDQIDTVLVRYAEFRGGKQYLDGPADLKRLLRGAGRLEFRILAVPSPENTTKYDRYRRQLKEGREIVPGDSEGWFRVDNPIQFFNLQSPADLQTFDPNRQPYVVEKLGEDYYVLARVSPDDGLLQGVKTQRRWKLNSARQDRDEHGRLCVQFSLDVVGGQLFETLTRNNMGKPLCILVDNVAYSAPNIQSVIRSHGQITGEFSQEKITYLIQTMEGGMLPARLKDTPLSERTVGSSLGEANRDAAVRAGLYAAIAVVVLMLGYYMFCGLVANLALGLNVLLVLAALAMLNARITLDGIAGIILAVGMAVDANVLIYERMREERARGASLRLVIKNGYDKALSTIFDSNITTLLTCVIIYYVGSEEVKGFGLTLGWGIVLNLFTSVFVTRTLFTVLLKYNIVKDIKMMRLIGVPNIDWYAKRKFFLPVSALIMISGLALLWNRGANDALDVEFLGGVAAEVELKQANMDDKSIHSQLEGVARTLASDGARLNEATVEPVPDAPNAYAVRLAGVPSERLAAMLAEPLEAAQVLERGGVTAKPDSEEVQLLVAADVTPEQLAQKIHGLAGDARSAGDNLARATVNAVLAVGDVAQEGLVWNITSTVTNMRLVEYALQAALGDDLRIRPRVQYVQRSEQPYPITDRLLGSVVPDLPAGLNADLTDFLGGAALDLGELQPPQSVEAITLRLENMNFQPDFLDQPQRDRRVIGTTPVAGAADENGRPVYRRVVIVTVDPDLRYGDNPQAWASDFALPEIHLVGTALSSEQTLRKVMQFKPQIAAQSTRQATTALALAWAMIIGYVWIRFGRPIYGIAGVAALVHDALIALAFVGISGWIGGKDHPLGNALLITDFKINMTIVAALLTIVGYSINDTIVVFDRIRETRGRLGIVTPEIINTSINQTLSRTLMTAITTLLVLLIAYIFGGNSIRGFNFCMIVGIITGTYSSIAIAAPLLLAGRVQPANAR